MPIDPGTTPATPAAAGIAPLRWTHTGRPSWVAPATWLWSQVIVAVSSAVTANSSRSIEMIADAMAARLAAA